MLFEQGCFSIVILLIFLKKVTLITRTCFTTPLVKFGESASTSVGAQTGDNFWSYLRELMFFLKRETWDWLCDLAFAVGILLCMNELNVMLQGKD